MKFFLRSAFIFLSLSACAQTTFQLGVNRLQGGVSFTQTFDHGYLLSGNVLPDTTGGSLSDIYTLVKLDSIGNMQWFRFYGDMGHDSYVTSVFQDTDGNYVFAGHPDGMINYESVMAKVNSAGSLIWSRKFSLPGFGYALPYPQCIETVDGNYTIAYHQFNGIIAYLSLVKLDKNGSTLWQRNFSDSIISPNCTDLERTSDNGVILGGSIVVQGLWGYYFLRIDSAGSVQWYKTFNDAMFAAPNVKIIQTHDNNFIATSSLSTYINVIRLDSTGDTIWTKGLSAMDLISINSIVATSDSNFVLGGYIGDPNNSTQKVFLVKMNQSGDTLWTRTYSDFTGRFSCNDIEKAFDGGLISFCGVDYLSGLLKTDSNGIMNCNQVSSSISLTQNTLQIYNDTLTVDSTQGSASAGLIIGSFWSNTSYYCLSLGGIDTMTNENDFGIFPNPSSNEITISNSFPLVGLKIYDAFGTLMIENLTENKIDVSGLMPGIYFIQLQTPNHVLSKKFIRL